MFPCYSYLSCVLSLDSSPMSLPIAIDELLAPTDRA